MTADTSRFETVADRDYTEAWDELEDVSEQFQGMRPRKDRQLNLRVDSDLLASLREAAARTGESYHFLGRRLIEEGVARVLAQQEERGSAEDEAERRPFRMKEVTLVLLGAGGASRAANEAVEGRTRLQKLLFLVAQHLKPAVSARFEAYSYGPFDETVGPDLEFLTGEGLVESEAGEVLPEPAASPEDRGARILEWIRQRGAERPEQAAPESYRLTQKGMEWVRRFLASEQFGSPEAKSKLLEECEQLKRRFGRVPLDELVDYVYGQYPEFTARSAIRHQVAERRARKKGRG